MTERDSETGVERLRGAYPQMLPWQSRVQQRSGASPSKPPRIILTIALGHLAKNGVSHFPAHVREAKVSARIAIGELLVVQTQDVQQGRV